VGTFNFVSKKDSSTMLPELTELVTATRMGSVRKVRLGLENVQDAFFHFFSMLLNGAYASKFETGWEP
jgi:hypothetical protein